MQLKVKTTATVTGDPMRGCERPHIVAIKPSSHVVCFGGGVSKSVRARASGSTAKVTMSATLGAGDRCV
jgi:hypothetical protein